MQFAETEICQLIENIWTSVLGMEVQTTEVPNLYVTGKTLMLPQEDALVACAYITGAWEGTGALHCSTDFGRQIAAAMFGMDVENATVDEPQDALGALVNIISGNLKALLPETCWLSFPAVIEGGDYTLCVPGRLLVGQVAFHCQDQPFLVTFLEREDHRGQEKGQ